VAHAGLVDQELYVSWIGFSVNPVGHVGHRYTWVMGQLFSGSRGHGLDV